MKKKAIKNAVEQRKEELLPLAIADAAMREAEAEVAMALAKPPKSPEKPKNVVLSPYDPKLTGCQ